MEEPYQTVASVIISPFSRELWVAAGPPDANPYEHYALDAG